MRAVSIARRRRAQAVLTALLAFCVGCHAVQGARLYHEGTRALDLGDAQSAVIALESAAARVPHASEVHNHLGLAYLAAGRPADAHAAFARAVALDCDNAAAQHNLRRARARHLAP